MKALFRVNKKDVRTNHRIRSALTCFSVFTVNPLSTNITKWSDTHKQFVGKLPTNCSRMFDHFVRSALRGLKLSKLLVLIVLTQQGRKIHRC